MFAISGTSGSSGFGSVRREEIESRTKQYDDDDHAKPFEIVRAGDH
jgi:hypothetical protein